MRPHLEDACPVCTERVDAVTGIDNPDVQPRPGDVSICFYCATVLRFDTELLLYAPDADEVAELKRRDPYLEHAQEFMKLVIMRRKAESN